MAEILYIIFLDFFLSFVWERWCMSSGKNDQVKAGDASLIIKCTWCIVYQQLCNKPSPLQNKTWQRIQLNRSFLYLQPVSPTSSPTNIYTQFQQIYLHPNYFHTSPYTSNQILKRPKSKLWLLSFHWSFCSNYLRTTYLR